MPIGKNERLTSRKLKAEQRRYKRMAAVYEKPDLTSLELSISNYHEALVNTMSKYRHLLLRDGMGNKAIYMEKEYIEVLLWLYQFKWFEWDWAKTHFVYANKRQSVFGGKDNTEKESKFFSKKLMVLYEAGYIVGHDYTEYKYVEYEQRIGYTHMEEKLTAARYEVDSKGLEIIRTFYIFLTGETPSKFYKKEKRLIWNTQIMSDFNDYGSF